MWFHARFKALTLDFLCNHEALVHVNIEEGHFNLEHVRASDSTVADRYANFAFDSTYVAKISVSSRNQNLSDVSVTFRVPFKMTGIKGRDTTIGNGENVISMLVFDYKSTRTAIRYYIMSLPSRRCKAHGNLFKAPRPREASPRDISSDLPPISSSRGPPRSFLPARF